jgi:transglutaminase-like putative cysteine protease
MAEQSSSSGASDVWTNASLSAFRQAILSGQLAKAAELVPGDSTLHVEARDILNRMRFEWSLSPELLQVAVNKLLPDATPANVEQWAREGLIESMLIDGRRMFFRREPRNLMLLHRKAIGLPETPRNADTQPIVRHLEEIVRESERNPSAMLHPVRTTFSYSLVVKPGHPLMTKGATVRCWLPYPQVYRQQHSVRLIDSFPRSERVSPRDSLQRTVYFEQKIRDPSKPVRFEVKFEYATSAVVSGVWDGKPRLSKGNAKFPVGEVLERDPHIRFTDKSLKIARELAGQDTDQLAIAKRMFHWVDEYCLIPSAIESGLDRMRGDCGIQALTFITLCRSVGIPARWQSGWVPDPFGVGNMHDWAEVWIEPYGWIPVDVSYGKKQHADERVRDFYFGNTDAYRLIVNLDYGQPLVPAKNSLRSEPLDFQRGEVEIDGQNLYFDAWDYQFGFEHAAIAPKA